jgi:protein-export membrane protein SecD
MRLKRYRILLISGLILAFGGLAAVVAADFKPRLGLDLEGGISVILTATDENVESDVLQQTVGLIRQRIDALGVAEPEVSAAGDRNILIQLPGVEDEEQALALIGTTAQLTFRQVEEVIVPGAEDRPEVTEGVDSTVNDQEVVYPSADDEQQLYRLAPARLTGEIVERAEAVVDIQAGANWSVSIRMSGEGARTWADFTSELACLRDEGEDVKSQVAIVLDGRVESAAGMRSPAEAGAGGGVECGTGITGGETQIDVGEEESAKNLALVLRTGALPLTLEQSEVRKVSPTLGRESLTSGLTAGFAGLALVMLYVLFYYRTLGLVIWLGFAQFTALLYVILAVLGETAGLSLTLAGVAGIIVSIGIAADSFIVAFERLKDEVRSGKSIRAAVERGSTRAIRTILIADFTTGAGALILFMLAVGPVRGFALTLGLATLVDVFLAFFLIRPAMVLLGRTKHLGGAAVGATTEPAGATS